jgi:hypothetical protein
MDFTISMKSFTIKAGNGLWVAAPPDPGTLVANRHRASHWEAFGAVPVGQPGQFLLLAKSNGRGVGLTEDGALTAQATRAAIFEMLEPATLTPVAESEFPTDRPPRLVTVTKGDLLDSEHREWFRSGLPVNTMEQLVLLPPEEPWPPRSPAAKEVVLRTAGSYVTADEGRGFGLVAAATEAGASAKLALMDFHQGYDRLHRDEVNAEVREKIKQVYAADPRPGDENLRGF